MCLSLSLGVCLCVLCSKANGRNSFTFLCASDFTSIWTLARTHTHARGMERSRRKLNCIAERIEWSAANGRLLNIEYTIEITPYNKEEKIKRVGERETESEREKNSLTYFQMTQKQFLPLFRFTHDSFLRRPNSLNLFNTFLLLLLLLVAISSVIFFPLRRSRCLLCCSQLNIYIFQQW